jgi:glutamine synthetase adenylyltransferase
MDFRLRGEGANAPLVQDIDFYARYFRKRMAPWERVAFAKCAHWWGDEALSQDFLGDLLGVVATPLPRDRLEALKQMRRRLEGLVPAGSALFETKRSPGGRYDIEYLTSIGLTQTRSSHALHTNTLARLDALFSLGLISREERAALSAAFELYQRIDFLLELQGFSLPNTPEKEKRIAGYLDRTFALLGFPMEGGVENALKLRKREVRGCYERITGSV